MVTMDGLLPRYRCRRACQYAFAMKTVLQGLFGWTCLACVDDVVVWGENDVRLVRQLEAVPDRKVYSAAHEAAFNCEEIQQ